MENERDITQTDVDDLWIREWVEQGIAELERYLARQAAFADFLRERDGR